jgi:uncharacterized SAM-binding protein YcdF (DUF218 family)
MVSLSAVHAMKKIKKALKVIGLMIAALAAFFLLIMADIWMYGNVDEKQDADVIIVLGAAAYESGVTPVFAERINHAADLLKQGYADQIILTGGVAEGNSVSDAWIASQYAMEIGISEDDLILEEESAYTYENMKYSKEIMDANGFETAIIVSDPLHMKRAMVMAKDNGIRAYSSPTPSTRYISLETKLPFLFRETWVLIGYELMKIAQIEP